MTRKENPMSAVKSTGKRLAEQDNLDVPVETKETPEDKRFLRRWLGVMVFFILVMLGGTIAIIIVATKSHTAVLPDHIDAILLERGHNRHLSQIKAIETHMGWIRHIYVYVTTDQTLPTSDQDHITYLPIAPTDALTNAFMAPAGESGVASHMLFLGDYTFPYRKVEKAYLFNDTQPRMFNYFRDAAEASFFSTYLTPTMPTFVLTKDTLQAANGDFNLFMLRELTEERVLLRNDMDRDIFVVASLLDTDNLTQQFTGLAHATPLFATFHVYPLDNTNAHAKLNELLYKEFFGG